MLRTWRRPSGAGTESRGRGGGLQREGADDEGEQTCRVTGRRVADGQFRRPGDGRRVISPGIQFRP